MIERIELRWRKPHRGKIIHHSALATLAIPISGLEAALVATGMQAFPEPLLDGVAIAQDFFALRGLERMEFEVRNKPRGAAPVLLDFLADLTEKEIKKPEGLEIENLKELKAKSRR